MNKTFKISFSLRTTYRVNCILYALKQFPLLGKLFPEKLYQVWELKIAANVLTAVWEVISVFLWKAIYLVLMVTTAAAYYPVEDRGRLCMHILIFLSILGAFLNTYLFDMGKEKTYALLMLRMDAREYMLINYGYAMLKVIIGFLPLVLFWGTTAGIPVWKCVLVPFFIAGLKLSVAALTLEKYKRTGKTEAEGVLGKGLWPAMMVLLAAAYGLPFAGILLSGEAAAVLLILPVLTGCFALGKILRFDEYYSLSREILTRSMRQLEEVEGMSREKNQKFISTDTGITSSRTGFEYLNELFMKRHKKILWKSSRRIAMVCLIMILGLAAMLFMLPEERSAFSSGIGDCLAYFVFIMYGINRGQSFTEALFVNCDHCLLTYSFYKQPRHILRLFRIRLREIIKVNMLPALVISFGLVFLLFLSGGTENPVYYAVILVSIPCMSVFFSVHYLTLYYLIQPYNAETKMKSALYPVFQGATYLVCLQFLSLEMPILLFGLAAIAFSLLYCLAACILIYKFAPKTFRLRN